MHRDLANAWSEGGQNRQQHLPWSHCWLRGARFCSPSGGQAKLLSSLMEGLCSHTTSKEKCIEGDSTKHTFLQEKESSRWRPSQVRSTCRQCCVRFVLLPLTHTLTLPVVPWLFYETDPVILYLNAWVGFMVEKAMEWEPAGYLSPNFTTALDAARSWSALPQLMLSGTPLNRNWEFMGYAQSWRGQVHFPLA